jgi:hypothetical protein
MPILDNFKAAKLLEIHIIIDLLGHQVVILTVHGVAQTVTGYVLILDDFKAAKLHGTHILMDLSGHEVATVPSQGIGVPERA